MQRVENQAGWEAKGTQLGCAKCTGPKSMALLALHEHHRDQSHGHCWPAPKPWGESEAQQRSWHWDCGWKKCQAEPRCYGRWSGVGIRWHAGEVTSVW